MRKGNTLLDWLLIAAGIWFMVEAIKVVSSFKHAMDSVFAAAK